MLSKSKDRVGVDPIGSSTLRTGTNKTHYVDEAGYVGKSAHGHSFKAHIKTKKHTVLNEKIETKALKRQGAGKER